MLKKSALITGASSGIGKATAIALSQKGYFVYLMGRDKERLSDTALSCPSGASLLSCDLQDIKSVDKRLHEATAHPQHQLEILVNNAGIYKNASFLETSDEDWMQQFQVNLLSSVRIARALFPYFIKNRSGSIVNVSSTLGLRPGVNNSAYSAVKAAMINWTHSIALEGAPFGIRANCVCPGIVDTPIHSQYLNEKNKKDFDALHPLGRMGLAEEIARSIVFLACGDSSWTTGAVLSVDGGINLK